MPSQDNRANLAFAAAAVATTTAAYVTYKRFQLRRANSSSNASAADDDESCNRAYYSMTPETWETKKNNGAASGYFDIFDAEEKSYVAAAVAKHKPAALIELGCGTGILLREMILPKMTPAQRDGVWALDFNAAFVEAGKKKALNAGMEGAHWVSVECFRDTPGRAALLSKIGPGKRMVLAVCNFMAIHEQLPIEKGAAALRQSGFLNKGDLVVVAVQHSVHLPDAFEKYYKLTPETCGDDIVLHGCDPAAKETTTKRFMVSKKTGYYSHWPSVKEVLGAFEPHFKRLDSSMSSDGKGLWFTFEAK